MLKMLSSSNKSFNKQLKKERAASNAKLLGIFLIALTQLSMAPVATAQFGPEVKLVDLIAGDGSVGFVLNGAAIFDQSGFSVSGAGDINNDGIDDLIVSAIEANPGGLDDAGEAYVIFGRSTVFPAQFELADLATGDGSLGFVLRNNEDGSRFGSQVSAIGDLNGDGIDDLAVGASDAESLRGKAYVVYGRSVAFPPVLDVSSFETGGGSDGFVFVGHRTLESIYGMNSAGDLNADGVDDVIVHGSNLVGIPMGDRTFITGYVIFGRVTSVTGEFPQIYDLSTVATSNGVDGFEVKGESLYFIAPTNGESLGDINGDGISDLIIGEPFAGEQFTGTNYVIYGRTTAFPAVIELASLAESDGTVGFELRGGTITDIAGTARSAGDINGDGYRDILIGATSADPDGRISAGKTYVVFGRVEPFAPLIELADIATGNGADGFVMNGASADDRTTAAGYADINDDGYDDILLRSNTMLEGVIDTNYVVYGRDSGYPAVFELSSLLANNGGDGSEGFTLIGNNSRDEANMLSAAGDINHDGIADLLVGATGAHAESESPPFAGKTYVLYGRSLISDSDNDNVADEIDNCLLVANPNQRDSDNDGHGNFCDADLNQDCTVNFTDFSLFANQFLTTNADPDFNGDGQVNFLDLNLFREMFIQPVGPSAIPSLCN